jgi:hypothetical protein
MKSPSVLFAEMLSKLHYLSEPHPRRDWLLLCALFLIALLLGTAWSVSYFFRAVNQEPPLTVQEEVELQTETLEKTRTLFEKRSEEVLRIQNEYNFVDPSL